MSKFNQQKPDPFGRAGHGTSPITTEPVASTITHEGAPAFLRSPRGELFITTSSGFITEDGYYRTGDAKVDRVRELVRGIAVEAGPRRALVGTHTAVDTGTGRVHDEKPDTGLDWLLPCVSWLRRHGNMRTAPIVMACEAVHARLAAGIHGGNRELIRAALLRADEPGELVAYWDLRFGTRTVNPVTGLLDGAIQLPMCVKRAIADVLPVLYTEYSAFKYDTDRHALRFGDVVDLVHPEDAATPARNAFYRWLMDRRHGRADAVTAAAEYLPMMLARAQLDTIPVAERRALVGTPELAQYMRDAGATWEWLSGWLADGKGMDAKAWGSVIPSMGHMARLRNLRNFDQAGVHPAILDTVAAKLMDPAEVAKGKQFPFRYLAACLNAPSLRWGHPLDTALTLSTQNIPVLSGRTAVYIDTSASMRTFMSGKSDVMMVDAAALFGLAVWNANRYAQTGGVDLYGFGDGVFEYKPTIGGSLIKEVETFRAKVGSVGHGTNLVSAIRKTLTPEHTRVLVFSDMQIMNEPDSDTWRSQSRRSYYDRTPVEKSPTVTEVVPAHVPLFAWNLEGYAETPIPGQTPNRYELAGLTDAMFPLIPLTEAGAAGRWPWELAA